MSSFTLKQQMCLPFCTTNWQPARRVHVHFSTVHKLVFCLCIHSSVFIFPSPPFWGDLWGVFPRSIASASLLVKSNTPSLMCLAWPLNCRGFRFETFRGPATLSGGYFQQAFSSILRSGSLSLSSLYLLRSVHCSPILRLRSSLFYSPNSS